MSLKIKNILLGGMLGAASISTNAGLINDIPYAMRDLHTFFNTYKDYKKLASNELKSGRIDEYYSPSSITARQDYRGNWEEYTRYSIVIKTVSKNGYALESIGLVCDSNQGFIGRRLYYSHDHQVLPQARQKLIVGANPTFEIKPGSSTAKLQNIVCKS